MPTGTKTVTPAQKSTIIWQENEYGIGEQALLINRYDNIIEIYQQDRYINLDYETLPVLIKLLKQFVKP